MRWNGDLVLLARHKTKNKKEMCSYLNIVDTDSLWNDQNISFEFFVDRYKILKFYCILQLEKMCEISTRISRKHVVIKVCHSITLSIDVVFNAFLHHISKLVNI